MLRRALPSIVAVAAVAAIPASAAASAPSANCNGTLAGTYQDVTVPVGVTCSISSATMILHDLRLLTNSSLVDFGASIGHDINGSSPASIEIGGVSGGNPGSVGHDINIDGLSGTSPTGNGNYICNQNVGHDVVVTNAAASATELFIGDPGVVGGNLYGCGNQVGHDLVARNNADMLNVSGNNPSDYLAPGAGIGHDLTLAGNTGGTTVNSNTAGHACSQANNHPYSGAGNVAPFDNCNTTY